MRPEVVGALVNGAIQQMTLSPWAWKNDIISASDANPEYATLAPPTYPIAFMTEAMSGGMNAFLELGLNFMTLVHGE
jgi:hypothetical protein